MLSRRGIVGRCNRRGIGAGGGGAATPLTILGSSLLQWVRADLGVTLNATRVSAWADQSGNAKDYTQATGASQPLYSASGGPNNRAYVSLDSIARFMNSALNLPQPSVTQTTIWAIIRQVTWVSISYLANSVTPVNSHLLWQRLTTPRISMGTAAANQNDAAVLNTWVRMENYWSGSAADYIKLAGTNVTGGTGDNVASTGRSLGHSAAGASAVIDICEWAYVSRALTAGEKTQLDAYATARYGAGLV